MSKLGQTLLFLGLIFLVLWFVSFRALAGGLMPFVWVLLALGLACILGAVFKDIRFFIELSGQRATKHGLNLGVLVVIVAALMVGVNFIGFRHVKKFDYTKEKLNSLSDQTKNILKTLDSDLDVRGFFAENQQQGMTDAARFKEITDLYVSQSPKVKVTHIDPIKRPDQAKTYDVNASGSVVLEYKGKKSKFEDISEQGFTNAIIKITRDKNKSIYFITGHGERDIESGDVVGAQNFKKYLTDSSYDVKTLSFTQQQKIPEDAALVIIAGPKQAYFDAEIKAINEYLYKGGKLFLALDPGTKTNLGSLTKSWGLEFKNNYILDQLGQLVGAGGATAVGINYSTSNEITKNFKQDMTVFHLASQLKPSQTRQVGINIEEIVKSSPASFSKNEIREGAVKFVEGKDEKGPLTVVAVVTGKLKDEAGRGPAQEFQAVVSGDSDFITNQLIDAQLNHDLALNSVAYLAKDKELVSIRPKQSEGTMITITQTQSTVLYYGLVFILPLLIFVTGGSFWYRRRTA
jgi:ABC-type uncharacterized transport system involved in gliding motility auxiliary subunit